MRVAEKYVQRLFRDPNPMEAIFTLSSFWSVRSVENVPLFGLAEPEFHAQLFMHYSGDVGNGGHGQFFLNPIGKYSIEISKALDEIGLSEIADIFQRARAVFSGGTVPTDDALRVSMIASLDNQALERWTELDRKFYSIIGNSWQKVLDYLREHQNEILRLERSLRE